MIFEALSLVKESLGVYIENLNDGGVRSDVVLGNISLLDIQNRSDLNEKVIISLVNLEEESALKNFPNHERINGQLRYKNPPVYLNLYILFSANWPDSYENAIRRLGHVVTFFQSKTGFTVQNTPSGANVLDIDDPDIQEMKLIFDLYTMTFEQLNHLWGALGGKQIPSALYKVRLVPVESKKIQQRGELITKINNQTN